MSDVVELAKALIRCPSVTPQTAGVFDVIEQFIAPLGFKIERVTFGEGNGAVENLYARLGTQSPNFCFAGHTDVVPPGDIAAWTVPPFEPRVVEGELIGRGAEDMKGAIAAFMMAAKIFSAQPFKGSISLLITQDEEGVAIHGTKPMLEWLAAREEKLDVCIVGEPTNPEILGEMAKVGRRGSVYFTLTVHGKQGHVAYPERADNPIPKLVAMLHALKAEPLDTGTEYFPPSNLEVTTVDVGNPTGNVIPAQAVASFNIRFNNLHTGASLEQWVHARCASVSKDFTLRARITGEAFLTENTALAGMVVESVKDITGKAPVLSTTGGTSDARFIKDYCPVMEFGTTGRTAHQIDERVEVTTLEGLARIYQRMLERYFV
jgi:succinyl-diaminopimelate desuccinylase